LAPSALIGLDDDGFLSFVKEWEHRWIITRARYKGKASGAAWFRGADEAFEFKQYYKRQVPGFMQQKHVNCTKIQSVERRR
jgi:hypothetical protein